MISFSPARPLSSRVSVARPVAQRYAARQQCRRAQQVRPKAALEVDEDTITLTLAAVAGLGLGIGIPVLFSRAEKRDKERIDEIRELNRATLKATGETLSEVRLSPRVAGGFAQNDILGFLYHRDSSVQVK